MDSLNALLVLHREHAELMAGLAVEIHALDPDPSGPGFGIRALEALSAAGAPLHGLSISMRHVVYDWSRASVLSGLMAEIGATGDLILGSSEGGLFEYGTDEEIASNLRAFYDGTPGGALFVGTVSRADGNARILNEAGGAALRLRGWEEFRALAQGTGWKVARVMDSPLSRDTVLEKSERPIAANS